MCVYVYLRDERVVVRDVVVYLDDCAHYTKCHRVYIYMQVDALPNKTICYMIYILLPSVAVQNFIKISHVITFTQWHSNNKCCSIVFSCCLPALLMQIQLQFT